MTTEEIDGKTYTVSKLPPKQALKLGLKVLKVAGVFASAFKEIDPNKGISDSQGLEALGKLFKDVDPEETVTLIEELVKCSIQGTQQVASLDRNFAGDDGPELLTALKVAWLVLRVNFGGILGKLGNSKAELLKA
jgi:hypothetical protein